MTKLISILIVLSLLFSLSACGAQSADADPLSAPGVVIQPRPPVTPLAAPELPAEEPSAEADTAGLNTFLASTLSPLFSDLDGRNRVYSPLSVYMALAMLTELTGGESQSQLLTLLGRDDPEALRAEIRALWEASYAPGGEGNDFHVPATVLPAASVWLHDGAAYHQEALDGLAKYYYASSFSGAMGSEEYTFRLREWINEHTNHLLEQQAEGLSLDRETLLALVTTLYFKANWADAFQEAKTAEDIFHAASGDETAPFMHRTDAMLCHRGERFAAVYLPMSDGNGMWILLPDEGVSPEELLSDGEALAFLCAADKSALCTRPQVRLSLPKFDVSSDLDLCDILAGLGLRDVFDASLADFSPLTDESGLAVTDIEHAARVRIDEEGCEAAAFTAIIAKSAAFLGEEPLDFCCDRPFFFAITGQADQMLFAGVVNTLQGA